MAVHYSCLGRKWISSYRIFLDGNKSLALWYNVCYNYVTDSHQLLKIEGLVQNCSTFSVLAKVLLQSCTELSKSTNFS